MPKRMMKPLPLTLSSRQRRKLIQQFGVLSAWPISLLAAEEKALSFAFIGDLPYSTLEEGSLSRMYQSFPKTLAFAVHIGDIKSGTESCSDTLITRRMDLIQKCPVPLILLPGDNEWVDCSRSFAGSHDPIERLAFWRQLYLRDQRASAALSLSRQINWPENLQWRHTATRASFVSLNVPGSFDAMVNSVQGTTHRRSRNIANAEWLALAANKARAEQDKFLLIFIHANTHLDTGLAQPQSSGGSKLAYAPFKQALAQALEQFPGHVTVFYGDTHQFRIEYPWEEQFGRRLLAVQCYGSPFTGAWLRVDLDAKHSEPHISPQAIP